MEKYYYDKTPFLYDDLMKWEAVIPYIQNYGDYIEVVEELTFLNDKENRQKIKQLLTEDVTYFKCTNPIERTISLGPFIIKNDYISVCFKYKISDELINELKTGWLEALKEENCIMPFIVFSNNRPIFWVHFWGAVILLADGGPEKKVFVDVGFKLEEWNISLNESLYYFK